MPTTLPQTRDEGPDYDQMICVTFTGNMYVDGVGEFNTINKEIPPERLKNNLSVIDANRKKETK